MMMMWSDSSKKGNDHLYELVLKKGKREYLQLEMDINEDNRILL